jgi:hypothetical protein
LSFWHRGNPNPADEENGIALWVGIYQFQILAEDANVVILGPEPASLADNHIRTMACPPPGTPLGAARDVSAVYIKVVLAGMTLRPGEEDSERAVAASAVSVAGVT